MSIKVAINGYGRIGRNILRALYEAKRKRAQPATSNWAVVRLKPDPPAQVTPKAREWVAPTSVAMQARLGNGVVLSWTHDQRAAEAPCSVLCTLAALPCFV